MINCYRFDSCGIIEAPVAQLDRAIDFGSIGWGFKSLQARKFKESPALRNTPLVRICLQKAHQFSHDESVCTFSMSSLDQSKPSQLMFVLSKGNETESRGLLRWLTREEVNAKRLSPSHR